MQVKSDYQNIMNTGASIESPHCFAWAVVCFPHVIKTLKHGFDYYLTFLPALWMFHAPKCLEYSSQCNEM